MEKLKKNSLLLILSINLHIHSSVQDSLNQKDEKQQNVSRISRLWQYSITYLGNIFFKKEDNIPDHISLLLPVTHIQDIQKLISDYNQDWLFYKKIRVFNQLLIDHDKKIISNLGEWEKIPDDPLSIAWDNDNIAVLYYNQDIGLSELRETHEPNFSIKILNVKTNKIIKSVSFSLYPRPQQLALSANNKFLACDTGEKIKIYDIIANKFILELKEKSGFARLLKYSNDGKFLIYTAFNDFGSAINIKILDIDQGIILKKMFEHTESITCLNFSPDEKFLVSACIKDQVKIWSMHTLELIQNIDLSILNIAFINSIIFSNNNKYLACACGADIYIFDLSSFQLKNILKGESSPIKCIKYSNDGKILASASTSGTLKTWDANTGICLNSFYEYGRTFKDLQFSKDNKFLAYFDFSAINIWRQVC